MSAKHLIVIATNSPAYVSDQVRTLARAGHVVVLCRNADQVLAEFAITHEGRLPEMLITPCLLHHGEAFTEAETNHGARTGLLLHDKLRRRYPQLPIIMITSINALAAELHELGDKNMVVVNDMLRTKNLLERVDELG